MFRLRLLIAFATDVFVAAVDVPLTRRITPEKLAKFVAIELRWPALISGLSERQHTLAELERLALVSGPA